MHLHIPTHVPMPNGTNDFDLSPQKMAELEQAGVDVDELQRMLAEPVPAPEPMSRGKAIMLSLWTVVLGIAFGWLAYHAEGRIRWMLAFCALLAPATLVFAWVQYRSIRRIEAETKALEDRIGEAQTGRTIRQQSETDERDEAFGPASGADDDIEWHDPSISIPNPPTKGPWRRGLQLSAYGLFAIFIPAAALLSAKVFLSHGFVIWWGLGWVALGALIVIPTICCTYTHLAHRRGDLFARRWLVAPLLLAFLITVVGVIAYRTYIVGFDQALSPPSPSTRLSCLAIQWRQLTSSAQPSQW